MTRLLILLALLLVASPARAAVALSEGFEDGTFNPPYAYKCDIPTPSGCTNTAEMVTAEKNSGTRGFKGVYNEGGAAGLIFYESDYSTFPSANYLRFYMKLDSAFRAYSRTKVLRWIIANGPDLYINCNGVTTSPWSLDVDGAVKCDLGVYFGFDPSDACGFTNEFYYIGHSSGANKGATWVLTAGDGWWYVEIKTDIPNRQLSMWIKRPGDSTATQVINNLSLSGCSGLAGNETFDELEFGWINDTGGGSGGAWYLDDIAVADTLNGLVGSLAPLAPKLLRVLK